MLSAINPLRGLKGLSGLGERLGAPQIREFFDHVQDQLPESQKSKTINIILAIDATENRQQTWELISIAQEKIFANLPEDMGARIQLVYFQGINEFYVSSWLKDNESLTKEMNAVNCKAGSSQILRVLKHIQTVSQDTKIHAAIFVGQVVEEGFQDIVRLTNEIAQNNVPIFTLYENWDNASKQSFIEIARLTKGASIPFDHVTPKLLSKILDTLSTYIFKGKEAVQELKKRDAAYENISGYIL